LITALEFFSVRVSPRGNWNLLRLTTDRGLTGLGEATHALGFTRASAKDDARIKATVEYFFGRYLRGLRPGQVEEFREDAWGEARAGGLLAATAFSALEQAMWDLRGKEEGATLRELCGDAVRERVPAYANINRAANRRTPEDFAEKTRQAVANGFRAIKAAVFDDYPNASLEAGIARLEAMRRASGDEIELMVDCHSRFDPELAVEVARRLEPLGLRWYEEPIDPVRTEETASIRRAIHQPMAGGELFFGLEGFEPLLEADAVDVIMPDAKHCGGVLELRRIAALAEDRGIEVSPHNPSGPVSMAVSCQVAAALPNCQIHEHAWGEADWRAELVEPLEQFEDGQYVLSNGPGIGIELNERAVAARSSRP